MKKGRLGGYRSLWAIRAVETHTFGAKNERTKVRQSVESMETYWAKMWKRA